MTNLNEVEIVACVEAPHGQHQAITATTLATAQLIATVPGKQDEWAECSVEVNSCSTATTFVLALYWLTNEATTGFPTRGAGLIYQTVTFLQGVSTVIDGRPVRPGMKLYAACLTSAAAEPGTANVLNVYVRPFLIHKK